MFITSPEQLVGKTISGGIGAELAFLQSDETSRIVWSHDSLPYRQFFELEINFSEGFKARIECGMDLNSDYYCLSLIQPEKQLEIFEPEAGDFIRVVAIEELPKGKIEKVTEIYSETKQLVGLLLVINGKSVEICCGEVIETETNAFEIIKPQEFVLVRI